MNHLIKEDNRLPDSWEMEIFFHKGNPKKFQVVSQKFFQDYLEIKTTKNTIHLIQRDSYSEIAFCEQYTIYLQLENERKAKEQAEKQENKS